MGRERQGCPAAGMGRLVRKSEPVEILGLSLSKSGLDSLRDQQADDDFQDTPRFVRRIPALREPCSAFTNCVKNIRFGNWKFYASHIKRRSFWESFRANNEDSTITTSQLNLSFH